MSHSFCRVMSARRLGGSLKWYVGLCEDAQGAVWGCFTCRCPHHSLSSLSLCSSLKLRRADSNTVLLKFSKWLLEGLAPGCMLMSSAPHQRINMKSLSEVAPAFLSLSTPCVCSQNEHGLSTSLYLWSWGSAAQYRLLTLMWTCDQTCFFFLYFTRLEASSPRQAKSWLTPNSSQSRFMAPSPW